jgi:hypothetical protein
MKPIGWRPPNIEGVLERQGWKVIEGGKSDAESTPPVTIESEGA